MTKSTRVRDCGSSHDVGYVRGEWDNHTGDWYEISGVTWLEKVPWNATQHGKTQGLPWATCRSQEAQVGLTCFWGWQLCSSEVRTRSGWVHQVQAHPKPGTGLSVRFSPSAESWTRPGSSSPKVQVWTKVWNWTVTSLLGRRLFWNGITTMAKSLQRSFQKIPWLLSLGPCHRTKRWCSHFNQLLSLSTFTQRKGRTMQIPLTKSAPAKNLSVQIPIC